VDGRIVICNSGLPAKAEFDIMDYKSIAPISDYPQPCIYDYCNCISMGTVACLGPSNITLDEYLKEKGDENEEERIDICSV
jgi:hypothetical protein